MRWEGLFEDLEGQWLAEERRERDAEVADRTRAERAKIPLVERYAASRGSSLTLTVCTGEVLVGRLIDFGSDWLLLQDAAGHDLIVAAGSVVAVTGMSDRSEPGTTARRFGMGYALRGLSRDRATVVVADVSGARVTGTIDGVGRDWCDVAEHPMDEPRRPGRIRARRTIPIQSLVWLRAAVRSRDDDLLH